MDELMALNLEASGSDSSQLAATQQAATPKFVSAFRVNGDPILPPLLTAEKKVEISSLRQKAIEVEKRLHKWRQLNAPRKPNEAESAQTVQQQGDNKRTEIANENSTTSEEAVVGDGNNNNILVVDDKTTNDTTPKKEIEAEPCHENKTAVDTTTTTLPTPVMETWDGVITHNSRVVRNSLTTSTGAAVGGQTNKPNCLSLRQCSNEVPTICVDPPTPSTTPPKAAVLNDISSNISISIHELPNNNNNNNKSDSTASSEDSSKTVAKSPRRKGTALVARLNRFEQTKPAATYSAACPTDNARTPRRSATVHSIRSVFERVANAVPDQDLPAPTTPLIIRSNSFTVETPSKVLLEQMQMQKQQSANKRPTAAQPMYAFGHRITPSVQPNSARDTVESRAKRVQKVDIKSRSSSQSSSRCAAYGRNPEPKRSPYDSNKTGAKPKCPTLKKANSTLATNVKQQPKKPTEAKLMRLPQGDNNNLPHMSEEYLRIFSQLQGEQRERFLRLQQQQQQEEQRLRLAFEAEREKLLNEMAECSSRPASTSSASSASSSTHSPSPPPPPIPPLPLDSSVYGSSPDRSYAFSQDTPTPPSEDTTRGGAGSAALKRTPGGSSRRRLFPDTAAQSNESNSNNNNGGRSKASPTKTRRSFDHEERVAAATLINAHVRGYLVRRLFQTEQIQRIVQTIRDTLIFVLNLHLESFENPAEANTPTNIKLKARLLQQLSSASRTLYLVFFQTSVAERMDIIARDRKRLKTKVMLSLRRSLH